MQGNTHVHIILLRGEFGSKKFENKYQEPLKISYPVDLKSFPKTVSGNNQKFWQVLLHIFFIYYL